MVITPSAMPTGAELSIGYFPDHAAFTLVTSGEHLTCVTTDPKPTAPAGHEGAAVAPLAHVVVGRRRSLAGPPPASRSVKLPVTGACDWRDGRDHPAAAQNASEQVAQAALASPMSAPDSARSGCRARAWHHRLCRLGRYQPVAGPDLG
jgi:hypothetical protein